MAALAESDCSWAAEVMAPEEEMDTNGYPRSDRGSDDGSALGKFERETDETAIARRTKQIEYGKNSIEYQNYIRLIPRDSRDAIHPKTPNKFRKYSRRAFDGLVRQWRLNLHAFSKDLRIPNIDMSNKEEFDESESCGGGHRGSSNDGNESESATSTSSASSTAGDASEPL